ncbi:polysaccharide deacetylase family protein [soil metagenome]
MERRQFIVAAAAASTAALLPKSAVAIGKPTNTNFHSGKHWPNGARLAVSVSLQFEAGSQPAAGAPSPFPPLDPKYPDYPATKWFEYGFKEGIPRLLDVFDRKKIRVTSHMVGAAVELNPQLAKEIVDRGHEASGHGQTWTPQFSLSREEEKKDYERSIATILRVTGTRPFGFNAFFMRGSPNTLSILQELGFVYHTDDLSRDVPFTVQVNNKPFAVVPYAVHTNDILNYEMRNQSTTQYLDDLKREFDMLYAEGATSRRMMAISAHDRVSGRPARAKALEEFIEYAQKHKGVWFARKDELAQIALNDSQSIHEV